MNFILSRSCLGLRSNRKQWLHLPLRFQPNSNNFVAPSRIFTNERLFTNFTKTNLTTAPLQNTKVNKVASSTTSTNNISNFYMGSNIFITGATGFFGKVLLEKLLRSCSSLEKVYVLIREKRGLGPGERLKILLNSPVFDVIREADPGCLKKVRAVYGDVAQPKLGLCETDRRLIVDNVNVVFHSAATVRLSEDLATALQLNTLGTRQMAELCKNMKNLKSFIYVSTAYSNVHRKDIEEKVYELPYIPASIIERLKNLPPLTRKTTEQQIMGEYPNSYVFSKALAEGMVLEYSKIMPVAIVRPSIIQSSWKEPSPGWVEITSGAAPITVQCARGLTKCLFLEEKLLADVVPVDVAANTLITAAWHSSIHRSTAMKVYNCTSGHINPLTWRKYMDLVKKYVREYPTVHVILYPEYIYTNNRIINKIFHVFLHYTPAVIYDAYLYLNNRKPIMRKICQETAKIMKDGVFVTCVPLNFHVTTFKRLVEAVRNAEDGKNFNIDMSRENGFDWDDQMKMYVLGIRQHVLKDDISSLSRARSKLRRLFWVTKTIQLVSISMLIGLAIW